MKRPTIHFRAFQSAKTLCGRSIGEVNKVWPIGTELSERARYSKQACKVCKKEWDTRW